MTSRELILDVMRRQGAADASALRAQAEELDGTEIISREGCVPNFVPGKDYSGWTVGAPVTDDGQVWQLLQPYDSVAHPGSPGELRAIWGLCHTKDPERAKPWVAPHGTSGMYMTGECYRAADGTVYRCRSDNTVHDAEALPGGWEVVV